MNKVSLLAMAAFAVVACSEAPEPTTGPGVQEETSPRDAENTASIADNAEAAEPLAINVEAPAGQYQLDPHHASLHFSVRHLGVSNYVMRFTDFDVNMDLVPDDMTASAVSVNIDPTSVRTDYAGDYRGTHPDSTFASWDEALARDEKFLNATEHESISFTSTSVATTDDGTLLVSGDLTLLSQTRPITLDVTLEGSEQAHPMTGVGLIGFSATGTFKRSDFGMTHLVTPPVVGDTVTVQFEGELLQVQEDDQS